MSPSRRTLKTPRLMADINITPFTDVILVLLIIFMISAPLISRNDIEVALPQASGGKPVENTKQIEITITAEGIVYIENRVVTNQELRRRLDVLLAKDQDVKVTVSADQACRFQEVVKVIDAVKEAGVKSLNIAARTANPSSSK